MLVSIICLLKWISSALALPVAVVVGIGLVILCVGSTSDYLQNRRWKLNGQLSPEQRDAKHKRERKIKYVVDTASEWFAYFIIGFAVLVVCALSAVTMMPLWGCDHCLPEFMQTQCTASNVNLIQQQDAATVRALCDKWGWTPPDMSDTPADSQPEAQ